MSPDYRLSRLTSPLPLTDITIDYFTQPSIATFSLLPSRHKLSVQCIIGPIIQFIDPVKQILALDSKSLEKLRKSVESQQSQACAGAAHN